MRDLTLSKMFNAKLKPKSAASVTYLQDDTREDARFWLSGKQWAVDETDYVYLIGNQDERPRFDARSFIDSLDSPAPNQSQ
jgi:hypothetical protein